MLAVEKEKLLLDEKIANSDQPTRPFNEMYRTALEYLSNPYKIWASGSFKDKRTVLKLTFANQLEDDRNIGYRTINLALPFKALKDFSVHQKEMVPRPGIEPGTRGFSIRCSTN